MMSFGIDAPGSYQQEPEKTKSAINYLAARVHEARVMVEELIYMLDKQDQAPWPEMLEKFSSLAANFSQLQSMMRKSALTSGAVDDGQLLKRHVLTPHRLSIDVDPLLLELSGGRVPSFNHDLVPDYLRTKATPELEEEEKNLEQEKGGKTPDNILKQITNLNKHVEQMQSGLSSSAERTATDSSADQLTFNDDETLRLVRAVMAGDELRPSLRPLPSEQTASSSSSPSAARPQQQPPRR